MRTPTLLTALSYLAVPTLAIGVLAAPTPAHAQFTKVTPSTLKFEGVRYWRKKANEATLGSVGKKMTPLAGKNYFQHVEEAPNGIYKVKIGGRTTISSKDAKEWGVTATTGNVKGSVGGSGKYNGTVTAYKMVIDLGNRDGDMRYETNRHHKHLEAVKAEGSRARLVSAVWILVAGDENKQECYSGDLKLVGNGWTVNTSASGCNSSSWSIAPGSIIAYEMVKIDKWDNKEIEKRPTCSSGYKLNTRTSPLTPMDQCVKTEYETVGIECKLAITDKASNWYVQSKSGRDTCKSRKGKKDKDVKCKKSGYDYVKKSGRDECRKPVEKTRDPSCPAGYDYNKKSTNDGGKDMCELRGIESLKPDSQDGF